MGNPSTKNPNIEEEEEETEEPLSDRVQELHKLAQSGDHGGLKTQLESSIWNARELSSALSMAASEGDLEAMDILIKAGAEVNATSKFFDPPLIAAVKTGKMDAVRKLLAMHAEINIKDKKGDFALIHAAATDNLALVKLLLESGANVNEVNPKFFRTALIISATNASKEVMEELLKSGADVFAFDGRDRTAISEATHLKRPPEIISLLKSYQKDQKEFTESIELYNKLRLIKQSGHTLGMRGTVSLKIPGAKSPLKVPYTGCLSNMSLEKLRQLLESYTGRFVAGKALGDFKKILEAMEVAVQYSEMDGQVSEKDLVDRYGSGKLVFHHPGHAMHKMGLALYKDGGVYCNRGEGGVLFEKGYTHIFKISDPKLLSESLFTETDSRESGVDLKSIVNLMEGGKLTGGLPSKPQKFGTCSFVNIKATIEGVLYLFEKERLQEEKKLSSEEIETMARHYAETEYKKFTKYIRMAQVNILLEGLKNAPDADKKFYLTILRDYVHTHHGDDVSFNSRNFLGKKNQKLELIALILKTVTETMGRDAALKFLESTGRSDILIPSAVKMKHAGLIEALRELVPDQIAAEIEAERKRIQGVEPSAAKEDSQTPSRRFY